MALPRFCRRVLACALVALGSLLLSHPARSQVSAPSAPRFDIQKFIVEGNTLLPQAQLDALLAPFTGPGRDFGDVQRTLEAMHDAYNAIGYSVVRVLVPEQNIRSGQVRLQVVEPKLGKVTIENNKFFDADNIRASLPELKEGRTPNTNRMAQEAQLANESPAKQTRIGLEAADEPGVIDATLNVSDNSPHRVTVSLDNTGTSQTGYQRIGVSYQYANLFNRDHVLNIQYVTSPDHLKEVNIYGAGYHIPFPSLQSSVDMIAGYSNVASGTLAGLFNVAGSGSVYGLRYTQLLPKLDTYEQKMALGWDYRYITQSVVLIGTSGSVIPDYAVQPISLSYNGRYSEIGRDINFYGSFSQNIPSIRNGNQNALTSQRVGAIADYSIWRYGVALSQVLPEDYLLRATFSAQTTTYPLVSAEQFGMGGVDSVRGYLEREVSNDIGHRLSLEAYTPDWGKGLGSDWRGRALVFVDTANGYDRGPPRSPDNTLFSSGIGVRLNHGRNLSVRADWARALDPAGTTLAGQDRFTFAVSYSF